MTDKEKLNAIRAEVQNYIDAAHKAHTNITEGNFAHLLSFIDSLQEELVSEDLREASRKYFKSLKDSCFISSDIMLAFKAGAKWQKEQIMKDATDAELLEGHLIRQKDVTHPLHVGDKVKIIIIKY